MRESGHLLSTEPFAQRGCHHRKPGEGNDMESGG